MLNSDGISCVMSQRVLNFLLQLAPQHFYHTTKISKENIKISLKRGPCQFCRRQCSNHSRSYNSAINFLDMNVLRQLTRNLHSQKKRFLNGSSEWSTVLPGTFCYLNQAKGSPNYIQLWRTIKGSSFSCEEP